MKRYLHTTLLQVLAVTTNEYFRIGPSLFRIGTGLTIVYQYLITYYHRHFLYGPDGIVPYTWFLQHLQATDSFSLYALNPSPIVFESIFHLGIVVTILWILGWHTRLMTLMTWIFLWSLHVRNPTLWDGGDNLIQIVLIYALFANLGITYSLDTATSRRCEAGGFLRQALALVHNAALLTIAIQLCLVYITAGLYKVQGGLWQNGTALYYILRVGEFAWTGYGTLIREHSVLVTMLTYGTVAFQVSFPFLFFMRRSTRRLALVIGISFHLGIGVVMGLLTFATFLISIELMFIPDDDYHAASSAFWKLWCALTAYAERLRQRR